MLRRQLSHLPNNNLLIRFNSTTRKEKWDLLTAVCIERKPQIVPDLTGIQKEFNEQLKSVEFEKSWKSAHEIRHERDVKQMELLKKGDIESDLALKQTAQDFVDMSSDELNKFQFGSVVTEADNKKDIKSTLRKLNKNLVLVTQTKIGDKNFYLLPQGMRNDGETLRQTADRVIKEQLGTELKTQIYGNAPIGFYKYKYPKEAQNASVGAKVFIYFARHNGGVINEKVNHMWLDRTELQKELPEKYHKAVQMFLIDE